MINKKETYNYHGWIISDSFLKRAFSIWGYNIVAGLIVAIGLFALLFLFALVFGGLGAILGSLVP